MKSMKQEDEKRVVCFKPDDVKCDDENDSKKGHDGSWTSNLEERGHPSRQDM